MRKRTIGNEWNFVGVNTKEYTHCYHNYPAMMIPQIARKLIKEYTPKNTKLIFDPYCGTGTSLLEAKLANINSIGTDLNPLAQLISKTKVENFNLIKIKKAIDIIKSEILLFSFKKEYNLILPDFHNINYWFSVEKIKEISFLLDIINTKIDKTLKDFFLVALSEIIRTVSYTRNGEFKLYRIPKEKILKHKVDTFNLFIQKLDKNYNGLNELILSKKYASTKILGFNTCIENPLKYTENQIDFVLTSPPYGDSRTTVAYGQFSRLSNQWLGINDANKVDSILMGGLSKHKKLEFNSILANKELQNIKDIDLKRYNEVKEFLIDYKLSIENVSKSVRINGRIVYVVGNRRVKNIQIPLDFITIELFEEFGFKHMKTIVREIPNKRMPKITSPTNKIGITSKTMNNEYIVIMEKI